jgi:hypothetical protein
MMMRDPWSMMRDHGLRITLQERMGQSTISASCKGA